MYYSTSGYHLPAVKQGESFIGQYAYAAQQLAKPSLVKMAAAAGRGIAAIEILDWADQAEIPNQYSYFKNLLGMRFSDDPSKYKDSFNRMFGTLGNGRLEVNDLLAFPINLWTSKMDFANKVTSANPNARKKESDKKEEEVNHEAR